MKRDFPDTLRTRDRNKNYRGKYGITISDYDAMFSRQGGVCAICSFDNKGKHLAVDHCHITGKVRQLLCTPCNLTVEHIENCKAPLHKYVEYISKFKDIHETQT